METTPAKYAKKALPSKGSREMRKAKMAYQAHWSEKEGIDTECKYAKLWFSANAVIWK